MLYFIDPVTEEVRAFLSEEDRDIFAPNCTLQIPEGMTPLPLSEAEQQARLNELLKQAATTMAPLLDANDLGIISDTEREQLTAWQRYRVALYRLPQSEDWPAVASWPQAPQ
jgi:hypothetical protein